MSRDRNPVRKPAPAPSRSGGGTLIGVFIGLVFGALIAAGAAWYFTRTNPFQSAPVAPRLPNAEQQAPAALPGKPGDRPVAKQDFEFYKILPQGENLPAPIEPQLMPPAAPKPAPVTPPQPLAQPAQQAPAPVQEAAVKPVERLYLQVGAFENPGEADNLKARLALSGIEASAQRAQLADGRVVHRVRIGPFSKPEDMNPTRARLAEAGFNASVSRASP